MDHDEDLSLKYKERCYKKPGLEVYSMWFEKNKIDKDTFLEYVFCHKKLYPFSCDIHHETFRTIIEKDPAMFKGRIFLSDAYHFHEIYNSSKLLDHHLYVDLPMETKLLEHCNISGHTDLAAQSSSPNDAQHEQEVVERTYLPMMGPHARIHMWEHIMVAVHRDSGNAHVDALYEDIAAPSYNERCPIQSDDDGSWHYTGEESFQLKVEGLYHSLILDCRMFEDSKSVNLEVNWVMTDENNNNNANANDDDDSAIYICGDLSVTSDGRTSLLFKTTPPHKTKRVSSLGQSSIPIPLLKSVFVVQYYADFEVCANLGCPDNVDADDVSLNNFLSVKGSVLFPHSKSEEDEVYTHRDARGVNCRLYNSTRIIAGSRGYLKVTATIDIK